MPNGAPGHGLRTFSQLGRGQQAPGQRPEESLNAANHRNVGLTRVQVTDPMRFFQGSTATLFGVTQVLLSSPPNVLEDKAFVRVGDAPPLTGGPPSIPSNVRNFNVRNFSNFMLLQTSTLNGNLSCSFGADAICSTPTNVSGSSTCGQCQKPQFGALD